MNKVVLLIDDEDLIRKSFSIHLRKAGFEILEAHNGSKAIDLMFAHKIDLVICDLTLPDVKGIDLIKKIKSHNNLPILAISGYGDEETINKVLKSGASGYLEKPVLKEKLLHSVKKILSL